MLALSEYRERFGALLEALDALAEDSEPDAAEALDDLNAEFEDALALLSELREDAPDCAEELADALEEFAALAEDYMALAGRVPGVGALAEKMRECCR